MKHAREDYNRRIQDVENLIPKDEPVFLIRGQDITGYTAVRAWAYLHRLNGGFDVAYDMAMKHADLMENWCKNVFGKLAAQLGYMDRYGFINTIHDSLVFCCPTPLVEECVVNVRAELQRPITADNFMEPIPTNVLKRYVGPRRRSKRQW